LACVLGFPMPEKAREGGHEQGARGVIHRHPSCLLLLFPLLLLLLVFLSCFFLSSQFRIKVQIKIVEIQVAGGQQLVHEAAHVEAPEHRARCTLWDFEAGRIRGACEDVTRMCGGGWTAVRWMHGWVGRGGGCRRERGPSLDNRKLAENADNDPYRNRCNARTA